MSWRECLFFIKADLYRHSGTCGWLPFLRCFLQVPGFKYMALLRLTRFLKEKGFFLLPLYIIARIGLNRYQFRYGICIPYNTEIGPGFYIGHFGGITVNHQARFGWNCNISQGVTVGATYGGKHPGSPTIGDNVYLGPGCKVVGGIKVGNRVAVGANSVLTRDVPEGAVAVGIPAAVISVKGSGDYVVNTVTPAPITGGEKRSGIPWPRQSKSPT